MSRLIYYKVKTNHRIPAMDMEGATYSAGPGLVTADHNEVIGGNGPLPTKGLPLVIQKLCKKHVVKQSQIVICNIIQISDKD